MFTYEKLFILLKSKGINKNWLRTHGINPKTVDKFVKNEDVKLSTISRVCTLLNCTPNDILTYIPDEED